MCSDSIHDAIWCAEGRGRTPARSIDAAIVKEPRYGCDCRLSIGIYRPRIHIVPAFPDGQLKNEFFARVCALLEKVILREQKPSDENALFRIESCAERRKNVKRGALSPCDQFESTTSDCIGLVAQ
jgi:hypothetical protein